MLSNPNPNPNRTQSQSQYHEHTDTFTLNANLHNNTLTLMLYDFVDNVIYFREYDSRNVIGEIHAKMNICDVFGAFLQARSRNDEEMCRVDQGDFGRLNRYVFGTVVEKDKLYCYKIEKEGKITTYLNIIDAKTKKQITYESTLILTKVRNMNSDDIWIQKQYRQSKEILEELDRQIKRFTVEKEDLMKTLAILNDKNTKLYQETTQIQQGFKLIKAQLFSKLPLTKKITFKLKTSGSFIFCWVFFVVAVLFFQEVVSEVFGFIVNQSSVKIETK